MKNTSNIKEQGSIVPIIVVIVVVALVGAVGFLFWQNFMQPESQSVEPSTQKASTPTSSATPPSSAKYATISDWGVRFKLNDSLKDTTVQSKKYNDEAYSPYGFSTDRVISTYGSDSGCDSIVVLDRMTDKLMTGGSGTALQLNATPINGYYYYAEYTTAEQYAANPNASGKAPACLSAPDQSALVESMKAIEAISN